MKSLSLITIILVFIQLSLTSVLSQTQLELVKNEIIGDSYLKNASIGIQVIDLSSGQVLVQNQEKTSLLPASTTKLFATASAFEMVGANYQPKTRIYYQGELSTAGVLKGDLWIRGGGDAALGSRYYTDNESEFLDRWADTLYKLGLRKVQGAVVGDGSEFGYAGAPDGWSWGDMGNYYGAGPSGLAIYDNMLKYYFKVNTVLGAVPVLTKTFPEVEGFRFFNYISGSKAAGDNSYIYGAPYSLDRFGTGSLQMNTSITVKGSIPDPELQFAVEFTKALQKRGIEISEKAKGARSMSLSAAWKRYASNHQLVYTNIGSSVNTVAHWTNQKSVNFFAEQLVCLIGYNKNGDGSTENGLRQLNQYWNTRINTSGLYLKDGSGLSRSNGISAEHFCGLLNYMNQSKNKEVFRSTLPVAGISGTLSDVCRNQAAQGRVFAKSGTMSRIKSYAGYVDTKSGKKFAFAIIFNNYNCSNAYLMKKIEKFMNTMANE
ncbi:MAG: D-alanyl-D-alanine carboxypeptidase/D-alanyl-D-alanine-endopeptidase [Crocinitomicaceae bacterium]|nr:D-alanyl-D-alanine carboxypeptidase/D-alanyl-D-alanine-endopeptidase [Crocinitomicaceae bacterium]